MRVSGGGVSEAKIGEGVWEGRKGCVKRGQRWGSWQDMVCYGLGTYDLPCLQDLRRFDFFGPGCQSV